jgi:hypothetical protein
MARHERLQKALLNFKLFLHYFDLSSLLRDRNVTPRSIQQKIGAVPFRPGTSWPRILNCALIVSQFVLANCFGPLRRNSFADDQVIELSLRMSHRGRYNVGGVVITDLLRYSQMWLLIGSSSHSSASADRSQILSTSEIPILLEQHKGCSLQSRFQRKNCKLPGRPDKHTRRRQMLVARHSPLRPMPDSPPFPI